MMLKKFPNLKSNSSFILVKLRIQKRIYKFKRNIIIKEITKHCHHVLRWGHGLGFVALVIMVGIVLWMSSSSSAEPRTVSLDRNDYISGTSQFGEIQLGSGGSSIQLQKGAVGQWSSNTNLQDIPSMSYGESNLVYGPNNTLYLMSSFDGQCHFNRYDIDKQNWTALYTPPIACGTGTILLYDGVSSFYYAPGGSSSTPSNRFFRYDISNDSWHNMADAPTSISSISSGVYVAQGSNKYVYMFRGMSSPSFWRYTVATDTWQSVASFPTTGSVNAGIAVTWDGMSTIYAIANDSGEFKKFDIPSNTWSALKTPVNLSCPRFSLQYVNGTVLTMRINACLERPILSSYSIASNTWTDLSVPPSPAHIYDWPLPLAYDGTRYAYTLVGAEIRPELYRYDTTMQNWTNSSLLMPNQDNSGYHQALIYDNAQTAYYFGGTYSNYVDRVYKYDISTKQATRVGSQINTVSGFDGVSVSGSLYVLPMPSSVLTFQRYDTTTNNLIPLADLPFTTNSGADIVDGGDGYLYTIFGGGRNNFYRYNISSNIWSSLGSMPQVESSGGNIVRIGRNIYVLSGSQSGFLLQYNMDTQIWSTVSGMPNGGVDYGGFMTGNGSRYLYIGTSARYEATTKKIYQYDTINKTWQRIADIPASVKPYASAFYDTTNNKLYVSQGLDSATIWDWSPIATSFVTSGSWYSKTFDFKQVDTWIGLQSTITGSGTATFYTRTSADGNVWNNWQKVSGNMISSPVNRYAQIKLDLASDGTSTPSVSNISIQYNQEATPPNLPSQFSAKDKKGGEDLNSGQTYVSQHPYFSWSGASDGSNGSGVAGYYIYYGTNSNADPAIDGNYQTNQDYIVSTAMTAGDVYYIRIKTKDNLGNVSAAATFFSYRYFYISPPGTIIKTSSTDFSEGLNTNIAIDNGSMKLSSVSTGTWSTGTMTMPPENTTGGAEVVIGDYLYIARGSGTTTFWRYNLVNQTWTTLSAIPSTVNSGSSITYDKNGNIYLIAGNNTNNFYKYSITDDKWSSLSVNLPSNAQAGSDIVYVGNGMFYLMFTGVREFYSYNSVTSQFASLQSYPTSITNSGSGLWFDGNDTIYAYLGSWTWNSGAGSGSNRNVMAKYSISTDSWRTLANPSVISVYTQNNLVSDGKGGLYIFANNISDNLQARQRTMRYDIADDSWSEVQGMPNQVYSGSATSDGVRYIYILPGGNGTNSRKIIRFDTYNNTFNPSTQQINALDRIAWDSPTNAWQWVEGNASTTTYDGSKYVYAIAGSESSNSFSRFVKFDYTTGDTLYLPPPPITGLGGSLGYVGSNIYYMPARSLKDFYKFDETLSQWIRMNDIPVAAYRPGPSSLVAVGDSLYVIIGNGKTFYKYTPDSNGGTWTKEMDAPGSLLNSSSTYDPTTNTIFVIAGNSSANVYQYNVASNTWSAKAALPVATSQGSALIVQGTKLYAELGNITKSTYIYDILTNAWTNGAPSPENFHYGSSIVKISDNIALAFAGDTTSDIWQFNFPSPTTAYNGLAIHTSQPIAVAGMFDYAGITAQVQIPNGTSVELWTQSSDDGKNWDDWSIATNIKTYSSSISGNVTSKPRRFTQIKIILQSSDNVYSPTVDNYSISYYNDIDPPTNPSFLSAYSDMSENTEILNNTWYSNPSPVFEWPDPGQPGGATDGPLGSNIAGYWVYIGTDPTASPRTSGIFVTKTQYQASLTYAGTYFLRIQTQDMTGNVDGNIYSPYIYKFDNQPPTNPSLITVTPSGFTAKNNFTFEWPNSYDAHSGVAGYCYHTGAMTGPFAAEICQQGSTISDISAAYKSGTNVFYLRTYDNAGNYSVYTTVSYYYATDPPNAVTNLRAIPPSSPQNLFAFAWDLPTIFSGDADLLTYCYSINILPSDLNTTCTTERFIPAFKAATQQGTNILYMVAKDEANNVNWNNFTSTNFIANTVSPGIPLNLVITDTSDRVTNRWSLTLTWDKPTFVGNGIKEYIVERSEDNHTFTKIGNTSTLAFVDLDVTPGVVYFYRVRASDNVDNEGGASGIVSQSARGNFAKPPQIVVQPNVTVGFDQAKINWATSREATSFVYYGSVPNDLSQSKGSLDLLTDHTQTITGLQPSTSYYYRVQSFDNARTYKLEDAYSSIQTFRTTEAARIHDIVTSNITSNSVLVTWTTSTPTKSKIEYGPTLGYGFNQDDDSTSFSLNHTMEITGLTSGTQYHYRIGATTEFGSRIQSDDYTFSTIARPQISTIRFQPINTETAAAVDIAWTTNVPTSSTVRYSALGSKLETSLSDLTTEHQVTLHNLASNTAYQIYIEGRDQYGNLAASIAQNWTSQLDTRPPVISNVNYSVSITESTKGNSAQLIATWKTDEPATSQIYFGPESSTILEKKSPLDTEAVVSHVVIISNLNLADIYKVQIISRDLDGNTVYSPITTLVTPDKEVSVLDNVLNLMLRLFKF